MRQAKLHKGSAGGTTNPYRRIPVHPNKSRYHQLSSFIPACPTSSTFPQWAIKSYDPNTIFSNTIDSDSEYEFKVKTYLIRRIYLNFLE